MNATSRWLGALFLAAATASPALANPGPACGVPQAPDACGPGFYVTDCYGCVHGPYYCLRPCFPPFNGLLPGPAPRAGAGGGIPIFPSHPYARGPRDFFMLD
jgi:hypothetical protein